MRNGSLVAILNLKGPCLEDSQISSWMETSDVVPQISNLKSKQGKPFSMN